MGVSATFTVLGWAEQLEEQTTLAAHQSREQRERAGSLKEASEHFATRNSIIREL